MPFFGGGGASVGIGGSTGATDNAILRADGTGGATLQNSDLIIDDATTTTQNNVTIANNHSQTDSAFVLCPKGTGAFIVSPTKPNGANSGGNARGTRAIDIQTGRDTANQVASVDRSICIGERLTASGFNTVVIGTASQATINSCIAIGNTQSATGEGSVCIGNNSTASGARSVSLGRLLTASLRGQFLTLPFSSLFWSGTTTNNTATVLNLDNESNNRFTIAANTAVLVDISIIARRTDTVDKWFSSRRTVAIRRNNANGTAIIGSVQTIGTDQTEGSPTWSVAITADDTNEALQVEVTGATGETVSWRVMAFYQVV